MQLAWFEQQNWLEIRNAQPDLSFFDGQEFYSCSAMFSRDSHHMYQLDEGISRFRIDDMDYVLENFEHLVAAFGALVALATVVTKLTPSKADDLALAKVLEIFSLVKNSRK